MNMAAMALSALLCLAAVAAQAVEGYLDIEYVCIPGDDSGIYANAYFIYSDTLAQSDAVAAFNSAGALSYESTITSSAALVKKVELNHGDWYSYATVSRISDMYALCFDQANNSMYVSPVANFTDGTYPTYAINAWDTSLADAKSASGGYQGAGWYYSNATEPTPEPTGYSVSLKEDTEDASNWQGKAGEGEYQVLPLEGVAAGMAVSVKYIGTKKVKSVKAVKVKPAATVTTAPTAKTGVKAGQNVAIVNAGTATGGTMMYKVTTANTKPTSTDGFSATVPTAEGLTAGTYYVWYYVKADDSHTDSEISATGIEVTIAAKAAAEATAEDKGKLIGTDGKIYADVAAATAAGITAVAKIIYIGTTGHATYSHGLALALTDEGQMKWGAAKTACNTTKNTSTPVTGATWLLASKDQWGYMMGTDGAGSRTALRDGFSSVGGSNLQSGTYWSSTEDGSNKAYRYTFGSGVWVSDSKDGGYVWVRACLAF